MTIRWDQAERIVREMQPLAQRDQVSALTAILLRELAKVDDE